MTTDLRIFVSHSAKDAAIAEGLIELVQNALHLPASAIRCTSVDGYRLPGGASTEQQLRAETLSADVLIGLVSPNSLKSMYVAFELGARWGANKHLLPILAPGVDASVLDGPLTGINALRSDNRAQLHQMVEDLARLLSITPDSPAAYNRYIDRILELPGIDDPQNASTSVVHWISMRSFLAQLTEYSYEANKLDHITKNVDLFPDKVSFQELLSLLAQFSYEPSKLKAIKLLRSRLGRLADQELAELMSQFSYEANKQHAVEVLR